MNCQLKISPFKVPYFYVLIYPWKLYLWITSTSVNQKNRVTLTYKWKNKINIVVKEKSSQRHQEYPKHLNMNNMQPFEIIILHNFSLNKIFYFHAFIYVHFLQKKKIFWRSFLFALHKLKCRINSKNNMLISTLRV